MDLDNITDIELLRNIAKTYMVQMKQDINANDGTYYIFKKGYWYFLDQDETGITIYTEDSSHACFLDYDEAGRVLIKKWKIAFIRRNKYGKSIRQIREINNCRSNSEI